MTRTSSTTILSLALWSCGSAVPAPVPTPVAQAPLVADFTDPDASLSVSRSGHVCVLTRGRAWCWGAAPAFEEDWGTTPRVLRSTELRSVDADRATCACGADGVLACWGEARYGCPAATTFDDAPSSTIELPTRCRIVASSRCAIDEGGAVWCWDGLSFTRTAADTQAITSVSASTSAASACARHELVRIPGASPAIALAANGSSACAIVETDPADATQTVVRCWGANPRGQLTDGPMEGGVVTTPITGATAITMGLGGTCAVVDSRIYCWGIGPTVPTMEELALAARTRAPDVSSEMTRGIYPPPLRHPEPMLIPGVESPREIAVGANEACAIDGDGALWCWGTEMRASGIAPVAPHVVPRGVRTMDMQDGDGCLIDDQLDLWCWGRLSRMRRPSGEYGPREVSTAPGVRVAHLTATGIEAVDSSDGAMVRP